MSVTAERARLTATLGVRLLVAGGCFLGGYPIDVAGQEAGNAPEHARQLIVSITSHFPKTQLRDDPGLQGGAGILIGTDAQNLYIVTARHVIEDDYGPANVWLAFEDKDSVAAHLYQRPASDNSQPDLDLAVISIPLDTVRALQIQLPSFDWLGEPKGLGTGAPVSPVGCPRGACWTIPVPPDQVVVRSRRKITFQSDFVAKGSSGGGLFNMWWEVVGLVTEDEPPHGVAIPIDVVLDQVRNLGIQPDLRKVSVPRGGYRTSVGLSVLGPTSSVDIRSPSGLSLVDALDSRVPSGRVTLTRVITPVVSWRPFFSWHAGALRLAPRNLSLAAGLVGGSISLPMGRFVTIGGFGEIGLGQVEGRYDAGGFFVSAGGTNQYVPFWNQVKESGVGTGFGVTLGASLEALVRAPVTLEVLAAHWEFTIPENAPNLPDFFVGAGLRWGF